MNVAEHQAGKSYVFNLDEDGNVKNCTVSGGGGRITGPTKEEQEQFEAEQKERIKRRVKYIRIIKESAEKQRVREEENLRLFQEQILIAKKDSLVYNRVD